MKYDCIIIGGGASGLMLAAKLNMAGHKGVIVDGTGKLGSKLIMSGGGHCNITHAGPIKDFPTAYGDAGRSLRKCLYRHNNLELIGWLESGGVPTVTNDEGRVFPESMKSVDVLDFLTNKAKANSWETLINSKVTDISQVNDVWTITVNDDGSSVMTTDNLVVASGGITYPETGSDGSVFELIKNLGIDVVEPRSALAPIVVRDYPYAELAGVSIPDVTVTAFGAGNNTCKGKAARMTGSLLFTHEGFSGPVILNISGYAEPGEMLRISYNKNMDELPKRMRRILEDRSRGESGDIRTNKLAALLDNDDFVVSEISERGMVTRGGIDLAQIDMSTMRTGPGLFAIGETIDADGITGGYNLQLCYSTACAVADCLNEAFDILWERKENKNDEIQCYGNGMRSMLSKS